jgi:hypothetical protein
MTEEAVEGTSPRQKGTRVKGTRHPTQEEDLPCEPPCFSTTGFCRAAETQLGSAQPASCPRYSVCVGSCVARGGASKTRSAGPASVAAVRCSGLEVCGRRGGREALHTW